MQEKKGNIIIVEGAQGVGKSTVANFLRDNIALTNLYRLSGIEDKSISGKEKTKTMYFSLIDYMKSLEETKLNLVFDRSFFSEQVYCTLGYKDYKFDDVYERLLKKLNSLEYNIYLVILYLKDEKLSLEQMENMAYAEEETEKGISKVKRDEHFKNSNNPFEMPKDQ